MRLRPALSATLCAATLLLAACHRSEPSPPATEDETSNVAETAPAPEPEPVPVPTPALEPVAPPRNEALPSVKPAPEVSADQQVIDDADATGMTARANREGDSAGDNQPASGGNNQD